MKRAITTAATPTRRPAAASSLVFGCLAARPRVLAAVPHGHQPPPQPQPVPGVHGQHAQVAGHPEAEHGHGPKTPWCRLVVSGMQNSTSNGSPATAGLCSRTASRSVATATAPMPATVSSRIACPAGAGGANLAVSSRPKRPSRHRWPRDVAVG